MKCTLIRLNALLVAFLCCLALIALPDHASAESTMPAGTSETFSFNRSTLGYSVTSYGPARSTDSSVISITSYTCNSNGVGSITCKAVRPGTATISMGITMYYGKWDSVLGYWREDTQYYTVEWTIRVTECETHNYQRTIDIHPGTCTDGRYRYDCSVCGDWYTQTIRAPHSYGEEVLTKNPTPTEDGTLTKTCTLCDHKSTSAYSKSHAAHINTQPSSAYAKVGSTATASVVAGGDGLSYQWYVKNYGASSFSKSSIQKATYDVKMNAENTGRQIYCQITDQYGNTVKSNTVTLYSDSLIKAHPQSVSAYRDDTASVTVKAVGQGLTYEWYIKSTNDKTFSKSSSTGKTYGFTMNDDRNGRQAYCIVSDSHGNAVCTQTVTFTMKTDRPVFITKQPESVKVFAGETAAVSVKATGKDMTYQWYFKNAGASKFSKTSTFTGNTYSVAMDESRDGRQVYCVITDAYGNKTESDVATLTMKHTVKITAQPKNASAVNGEKATATVQATGDGLTYQWYVKSAAGDTFTKSSTTNKTYTIIMSASVNGRNAYCVVTDKYGNSVKTNTITLKRTNIINITKQPTDVSANEGKQASVSIEAKGEGLTYQWYFKNAGASKFAKTSTFTGTTYSVAMSPDRHGRQVYCLITDKYGTTKKTNTATLSMNHPITISKQPANTGAYYGDEVSVSVSAKGYGLTYQWYAKNVGESTFSKSSITGPTYAVIMTSARDGRQVFCRITDQFGGTKDTNTVTISMKNEITITQQPSDFTGVLNQPAQVSVKAEGEGLTYRWYFKDKNGSAFSKSSITSKNYSVKMNEDRDGRQLYCKITDKYGYSVISNTVTIHLNPVALTILQQPVQPSTVGEGTEVSVTFEAQGTSKLNYQWYVRSYGADTFQPSSIRTATYSIAMSPSHAFSDVYCVASDAYGNSVQSKTVTLRGAGVIVIYEQPRNVTQRDNLNAIFEVNAVGHQLQYQWYYKSRNSDTFAKSHGYGTTTYKLTLPHVGNDADGCSVYCVITDSSGYSITTDTVKLDVYWTY